MSGLGQRFGGIDIYLFDQLLRGRFAPPCRVLDAGCGSGRNLHYLLQNGFDVFAVDRDADAVRAVRELSETLGAPIPEDRARVAEIDSLPFDDESFDAVLSSAVLHFATGPNHFGDMLEEMWRVLRPGGLLWVRLASSIGIEGAIESLGKNRYRLPDGTDRFLVDEAKLLEWGERLGGRLLDPIKTTNVQGLRCMTTWVLAKDGG
jgi:tellurite methyltransferase